MSVGGRNRPAEDARGLALPGLADLAGAAFGFAAGLAAAFFAAGFAAAFFAAGFAVRFGALALLFLTSSSAFRVVLAASFSASSAALSIMSPNFFSPWPMDLATGFAAFTTKGRATAARRIQPPPVGRIRIVTAPRE